MSYSAFQAQVAELLATPLWSHIEAELRKRKPVNPAPTEAPHVAAQRAFLSIGFEEAIATIRELPFTPPVGEPAMPGAPDELMGRLADPTN